MTKTTNFAFSLNDKVKLSLSNETGFVVGRAEYLAGNTQYSVRYVAADGRQVEAWFDENALFPAAGAVRTTISKMRAKLQITNINENKNEAGETTSEQLSFMGVAAKTYDATGLDEDNTYAKFSPQASFSIMIANPNLFGQFKVDEKYYVDFTPAAE